MNKYFYLSLIFFLGLSSAVRADDRIEAAVRVLVTLCVDGGTVKTSSASWSPTGGQFHLETTSGSFTVLSRDAIGLTNGLEGKLDKLASDQADRARECMKPYISQLLAIALGRTEIPDGGSSISTPNAATEDESIVYYLKSADNDRIGSALKSSGISFTQLSSVLPDNLTTNGIRCTPDASASAIKAVAYAMINAGIPIQHIDRTRAPSGHKIYLISITGADKRKISSPPLSRQQIDDIDECPQSIDAYLANFAEFDNPHPSMYANDHRYVDGWGDKDHNLDQAKASRIFCQKHGYNGSVDYKLVHVQGDGIAAVRLADSSICTEDCYVFGHISCE